MNTKEVKFAYIITRKCIDPYQRRIIDDRRLLLQDIRCQLCFLDSLNQVPFKYYTYTVKVKSLAPLFCFQLFISTTQHLFNSIIFPNSKDQVLHLYIYVQNEKPLHMKYTEKNKH